MIRLASILPALAIICLQSTAWSFNAQSVTEQTLADRTGHPWQYAELESEISQSIRGRSFAKGQQLFKAVRCNACHRMDGDGNEFGPDLASLGSRWTPSKVLRHTLEPSYEVNKEYRTHIFELESGEVITGIITAVGLNSLKVVENPLQKKQPKKIKDSAIRQRHLSRQSIMPSGLLDKLSRSEVFDLLAYVYSGGNDRHTIFQSDATRQ